MQQTNKALDATLPGRAVQLRCVAFLRDAKPVPVCIAAAWNASASNVTLPDIDTFVFPNTVVAVHYIVVPEPTDPEIQFVSHCGAAFGTCCRTRAVSH